VRHTGQESAPHALVDHPLPGIDPGRLGRLQAAGIDSLESLVEAGPERLAELTGFDRKTSLALVRVAESALARVSPGVIEFTPRSHEAPARRLARGLEAAREVEVLLGLVRKARSHAGKEPGKKKWKKKHRRARRQLKKLSVAMEFVQQDILADGLSDRGLRHLRAQLDEVEPLRPLLEEPIRGRTLKKMRKVARRARRAITGRRPR